jgi:RNA polymerase sigma factor (TIGR02999 family)
MAERAEITDLLTALERGDPGAQDAMYIVVYDELRRIARTQIRRSGGAITINPTTLVHEVWLKLAKSHASNLEGTAHFYNLFAQAMRQILLDLAKFKGRERHGGGLVRAELTDSIEQEDKPLDDLILIDRALAQLRASDADLAQLVEWHFFVGLTVPEIAQTRRVSERTVKRHLELAKVFLGEVLQANPN